MADFSEIIQEINTNLPDNNTQAITAAKLRTTLVDLTNAIDTQQDNFETTVNTSLNNIVVDSLTSTDTDKALSANQGKVLNEKINETNEHIIIKTSVVPVSSTPVLGSLLKNGSLYITGSVWKYFTFNIDTTKNYKANLSCRNTTSTYDYCGIQYFDSSDNYLGYEVTTDSNIYNGDFYITPPSGTTYCRIQTCTDTDYATPSKLFSLIYVAEAVENVNPKFESNQNINSVSIINNLTTGGENNVLSAEQGKVLNKNIENLNTDVFGGEVNHNGEIDLHSGTGSKAYFTSTSYNYTTTTNIPYSYYYEIPVSSGNIKITNSTSPTSYVTFLSSKNGLDRYSSPNYSAIMNGEYNFAINSGTTEIYAIASDMKYMVLRNRVSNGADFSLMPSKVEYTDTPNILLQSEIFNKITHFAPENIGQLNAVRRMRKLTDVKWIPSFQFVRLSSGGGELGWETYFSKDIEYKGIPYSRAINPDKNTLYGYTGNTGFKIGMRISLETFITAVYNRGTVMEIESVFAPSSGSFYANICAGAVDAALGLNYITTAGWANVPSNCTSIGYINSSFDFKLLRLGDVIASKVETQDHTGMITDIIYENGEVKYVEIGECSAKGNENYTVKGVAYGGIGRRLWWTIEEMLDENWWGGYRIVRYNNIANVSYTPSPYAPMPNEHYGNAPHYMACLPYMGNGFRFVQSNMPDTMRKLVVEVPDKDVVHIFKKNATSGEFESYGNLLTIDYTDYDATNHPYVYVELPSDMPVGEYQAYCCKYSNNEETNKSRICKWGVVQSITNLEDF